MAYNWKPPKGKNFWPGLGALDSSGLNDLGTALNRGLNDPNFGATNFFLGMQGNTQQQGGSDPYASILGEYMNTMQANFGAQSAADAAARDAAIRRAVISYGEVPDFEKLGISDQVGGFLKKAINDKTRSLAEQNYKEGTAVKARQQHAFDILNRQTRANDAARGALHSGGYGYRLGENQLQHKIQGFDTLNQMLDSITGAVNSFLTNEQNRKFQLAQLEMQQAIAAAQARAGRVAPSDDSSNDGGSSAPVTTLKVNGYDTGYDINKWAKGMSGMGGWYG